ncbi:MAG: CPBP family intramembrane metalloprotease [Deltaproteobacteria bacterium]|nr:CPBP family intramembrane metalloprotease [Deltaproteobacteria bacterium]
MAAKNIDLKILAACTAVVMVVESGLYWAAGSESISPLALIGGARVLEGLLILVLIAKACPGGLAAIGLSRRGVVSGIRQGLIWSAAFGALVALVCLLVYMAAGINALARMHAADAESTRTLVLFFIVGGGVSPVAEEIFFRGVLYGYLRRWGVLTAVIFSTLLFALAHAARGGFPLTQSVGGLLFALAYERERSLLVPIVIHVLGNLAIFSVTLF